MVRLIPLTMFLLGLATIEADPSFSGTVSYGIDATFWKLDDSFTKSGLGVTTDRSTPIFQELHADIRHIPTGLNFVLDLSADQINAIGGLFDPSLGKDGASGGIETHLTMPLSSLLGLIGVDFQPDALDWGGDSIASESLSAMRLALHYKYRVFRWKTTITSNWSNSFADYYNEAGQRSTYNVGESFFAASRWHNLQLGVELPIWQFRPDDPLNPWNQIFLGVDVYSLQAPTFLTFDIYSTVTSTQMIMQTWNYYVGLFGNFAMGFDRHDPRTLRSPFNLAFEFGVNGGFFSASNDYFQGAAGLGAIGKSGLFAGFVIDPGEGTKVIVEAGVEGTLSVLYLPGLEEPRPVSKTIAYNNSGAAATIPSGSKVQVSIFRLETYVAPSLQVHLWF